MTAITRFARVTGIPSVRTGTPFAQSGSLSRQMRRSSLATSSTRWSTGPAKVPTTSSWSEGRPTFILMARKPRARFSSVCLSSASSVKSRSMPPA